MSDTVLEDVDRTEDDAVETVFGYAVVVSEGPEGGYSEGYPREATEDEFLESASVLLGRALTR